MLPRRSISSRSEANRASLVFGVLLSCALAGVPARAQAPAAPAASEPPPPEAMAPPSLREHPEAPFPPAALEQRAEGNVGLELDLDAGGNVVGVRVTRPAGHGFDEAAAEAARHFSFDPARRRGVPVPSTVQFTYEFHLPPLPPPPPPAAAPALPAAPAPPRASEAVQTGPDQSTLVLGSKPISAASSFSVQDRDFQLRPIGSVQDILRVTPGLVMVQHSGGGKANQYFLRGFDADHGTDLALSIDGVPINLVSHAHGQGFADTNFIIPEVVERVEITKGPYFAEPGRLRDGGRGQPRVARRLRAQLGRRRGWSARRARRGRLSRPGDREPQVGRGAARGHVRRGDRPHQRAVRQPRGLGSVQAVQQAHVEAHAAVERQRRRDELRRQLARLGADPGARRRQRGSISRFGSIDPDEGGDTARHQIALAYRLHPTENSELRALAYLGDVSLQPVLELHALPATIRTTATRSSRSIGARSTAARSAIASCTTLGRVSFDTTIGGDVRSDDIHEELWDTVHRAAAHRRAQQRRARDASSARTSTKRSRPRAGCAPTWARAPICSRSPSTIACRRAIRPRPAAASTPRTSSAPRRA